jgi:hypothetical protein
MTDLNRYLDDLGSALLDADRSRPRRGGIVAASGIALALGAAILLAIAARDGQRVDALASARAALSPNDEILHIRVRFALDASSQVEPTDRMVATKEIWSAEGPSRWRIIQRLVNGDQLERAYAAGVIRVFDAQLGTLVEERNVGADSAEARSPSAFGSRGDREVDLHAMLARGELEDRGDRTVGGRLVRRLATPDDSDATTRITYDVDPTTFSPIAGTIRYFGRGQLSQQPMAVLTFKVEAYERLSSTAENRELLTLGAP